MVRYIAPSEPFARIALGEVEILVPEVIEPTVEIVNYRGVQPFRLVLFAEKSAVGHVVLPLADQYDIDTYLMGGEASDTRIHEMAVRGAADDRPMVVFTLSDADPAGYWMPATIAWKLKALKDSKFPDDDGVDAEADQIEDDWLDDAEDALDEQLTDELLARWRERARDQLAALLEQSADRPLLLGQLNAALNVLPDEIDLPDLPEAPVGTAAHGIPNPLAHSGMSHFEFLEAVNTRREYLDEAKRKKGDRRASLNP